jgi:predicted O-methyltransferase YrrM
MRNPARTFTQRSKLVLKMIEETVIQVISPDERQFRRIWPAIGSIEGMLVSPLQERWLFKMARSLPDGATIVEIGCFKGRSTSCLAYGCRGTKKHVFAVDTFEGNDVDFRHRGFFAEFQHNIEQRGLINYVTPLRGCSSDVAKTWNRPIHFLFIDGSHQYEDVIADFHGFYPHVVPGCGVAVHDVVETWPGPLKAWRDVIQHKLSNVGTCSTLAYGVKPI